MPVASELEPCFPRPCLPPACGVMELLKVWVALQSRAGGGVSATGTGTPSSLLEKLERHHLGGGGTDGPLGRDRGTAGADKEGESAEARDVTDLDGGGAGDARPIYVLCTGSLYVVAEALRIFRAEVV